MYKKALQEHVESGYYLPHGKRIVQYVYPPLVACLGRRQYLPFGVPSGLILSFTLACDNKHDVIVAACSNSRGGYVTKR